MLAFDELKAAYGKAQNVILNEEGGVVPRFYVRILVELEDFTNEIWNDPDYR